MMQIDAPISDVETSGPFVRVVFAAPALCSGLSSGRFVLADLGDYLRTPLFPTWVDSGGFEILVPPNHPTATLQPGARVNLLGPLGQGFDVPMATRRLLLVADTTHLPVLLPLTRSRNREVSVTLLLSTSTAVELYPIQMLPSALEVHLVTADGSAGHHGSALDLFPDLARWADCVCIAQDPVIYPTLAEIVRKVRIKPDHHFAQALVVPPVVCGVGACQGCAVEVARGTKLACTDGPVFDLLELQ
jgi:dihydroorotate dehydrogenase electron transfer subunit